MLVNPLDVGASLLLGQRSESEVWLDNSHLGEDGARLLSLDAGVHNDVVTLIKHLAHLLAF